VAVEFAIRYSIGETNYNVKLGLSEHLVPDDLERKQLLVPVRVATHDTVSGWCDFVIGPNLLNDGRIESYELIVTDTHDAETRIELSVVGERPHV
jgi:hypothetical protein